MDRDSSEPTPRPSTAAGLAAAQLPARVLVVAPIGAIPRSEFEGVACIVTETSDPFVAVSHIKAKSADLVVIDFALPHGQGPALLTLIRAQSNVPVLVLARGAGAAAAKDLLTCDRLIVEGMARGAIRAHLLDLIDHASGPIPAGLADNPESDSGPAGNRYASFAGFQYDAVKRVLEGPAGQIVDLTSTPMNILHLLVLHANEVVSRKTIHEFISRDGLTTEGTVSTHIKTLRQVFNAVDPGVRVIRTEHGVGYRLVADGSSDQPRR